MYLPVQIIVLVLFICLFVLSSQPISQITWHGKGDYFATVVPQGEVFTLSLKFLQKILVAISIHESDLNRDNIKK